MKIAKLLDVRTPERGTSKSAGIDFFVPNDYFRNGYYELFPGENVIINSGIKIDLESLRDEVMQAFYGDDHSMLKEELKKVGVDLVAVEKSGLASKHCLFYGAKLIDQDYQNVLHIDVHNLGTTSFVIKNGMKIVQFKPELTFYPDIEIVDNKELFTTETERGINGFGHTGL